MTDMYLVAVKYGTTSVLEYVSDASSSSYEPWGITGHQKWAGQYDFDTASRIAFKGNDYIGTSQRNTVYFVLPAPNKNESIFKAVERFMRDEKIPQYLNKDAIEMVAHMWGDNKKILCIKLFRALHADPLNLVIDRRTMGLRDAKITCEFIAKFVQDNPDWEMHKHSGR